jgi:hypothetical protein
MKRQTKSCLSSVLAFVSLLTFPLMANAAGTTDPGKITSIEDIGYGQGEGFLITTSATFINPDSCTTTDAYVFPDATGYNYKSKSGILLAAYLANKDVRFYVSGCYGGRPAINLIIGY